MADRSTSKLSERQVDILTSLAALRGWIVPMDIGGGDGSHHSDTLRGLVKRKLAERNKRHAMYCYNGSRQRQKLVDNRWVTTDGHPPHMGCCCKGSCSYRITPAGRAALRRHKEQA